MIEATRIGEEAAATNYSRSPSRTYAVGTSNGGYQVRRALETAPELFDGGIDWEGTYVDPVAPNLLSALPPAILNFPDYVASGYSNSSTAAENIVLAGYPPDIVSGANSLWGLYWAQFWEVTLCQWQKRLDPSYDTYVSGTGTYSYVDRLSVSDVGAQLAVIATTGDIGKPLITVAGTMDALLPINLNARAYARAVAAALSRGDREGREHPAYRLYEVQNGNQYRDLQGYLSPARADPAARAARLRSARGFGRAWLDPASGPVHPAWRLDRGLARPAGALRRALCRTVSRRR